MPVDLKERWEAYTEIFEPLRYALWFVLQALGKAPLSNTLDRSFATWYSELGHHFASFEEEMTPVPRLVGMASGTVLEIGPGTGNQLARMAPNQITRVYGIEPNAYLLESLHNRLEEFPALALIYVPLHAALEDEDKLSKHGIISDSVDTVVCMQILCSVKNTEEAVRTIYRVLKPGGQLLFWEHRASTDPFTKMVQWIWSLIWSPLVGHCSLAVNIEGAILNAASWEVKELGHDELGYNLMPRVWGHFVKPKESMP